MKRMHVRGGVVAGVWAAHPMFELPIWQASATVRTGPGQWFAETIATFGLLLTVLGCVARALAAVPMRWASTSPRPTGSRHPRPSPIRP